MPVYRSLRLGIQRVKIWISPEFFSYQKAPNDTGGVGHATILRWLAPNVRVLGRVCCWAAGLGRVAGDLSV